MLEQLRRLWFWLSAQDPALNLDQRMARWVNSAAIVGFAVTGGTWMIGWALDLPWFVGLLIGLVVWVVALNAFVSIGRRRHNRQMAAITGGAGVLRVPTSEKFDKLQQEVQEMKADLRRSEQERERLAAERDTLKETKPELDRPNDQLSDDDLKERCRELAEDLHEFLEEYAWDEVARAEGRDANLHYEIAHADQETMRLFRKRLEPRVMRMLAELKRRSWWKEEHFDLSDWESVESVAHPTDLQLIADRLERLGYGL